MSYVAIPVERIGACDWCGAVDHHLVEGLCPTCRPKTITVGDRATACGTPARRQGVTAALQQLAAAAAQALRNLKRAEEPPLGMEADVSHVRRPKGAR